MGGDAIEAEAKSFNIITRTMQKKVGDWYKQAIEITSGKKGRKESDFKKKENKENYFFFSVLLLMGT